ncbi:UNVERIFIED_ORG: hypothetical protein ABRZ91_003142 [Heyndrickxia coagulans]
MLLTFQNGMKWTMLFVQELTESLSIKGKPVRN